jgi:hypothetical protein
MHRLAGLSLSLFVGVAANAQSITSTFAAGNEGWTVVQTNYTGHITLPTGTPTPAPFDGLEGLPAGSIRIGDVFGDTGVRAPAAFVGDRLAWFGGRLSYDIRIRNTDGVIYPALWLVGATKTLVFNTPSPTLDVWQHVDVPLLETGFRVNGWQGNAATRGDLMEVLADLRGILINTEWRTGPDDTSLDNIELVQPATGATCYGAACPGSNGRWPTTWVTGNVASGSTIGIEVTDGVPGSFTLIVVGFRPANAPLFGCTAWIDPTQTSFFLGLDGNGRAAMTATLPPASAGPLATLQSVLFDASAPNGNGLVLTNAVQLTVP